MPARDPVVLLVLVETATLRWFVAALGFDGQVVPLFCSEVGNLAPYQGVSFDEQVAFLRHRFCGVLQRGCHKLWEQDKKACQFVFVFEGLLPEPTGELTRRIAEHFTEWMLNPPVAIFASAGALTPRAPVNLDRLAGQIEPDREQLLRAHLDGLLAARENPGGWELAPKKTT
jgi:hypothetical protein